MKILQIAVGIIRNPQGKSLLPSALPMPIWRISWSSRAGKLNQVKRRSRRWFASCRKRWGLRLATLFDKLEYQFPDRHITLWFWLVKAGKASRGEKKGSRVTGLRRR
jgi:8-oxo-dGTP diphosphatase